jgi:hypothetical protein
LKNRRKRRKKIKQRTEILKEKIGRRLKTSNDHLRAKAEG